MAKRKLKQKEAEAKLIRVYRDAAKDLLRSLQCKPARPGKASEGMTPADVLMGDYLGELGLAFEREFRFHAERLWRLSKEQMARKKREEEGLSNHS